MDALLTINAGTQRADTIAPTKVSQKKHEEEFGQVLHKKRNAYQSGKKRAEKHSEPARRSEQNRSASQKQETAPQEASVEPSGDDSSMTVTAVKGEDVPQVDITKEAFATPLEIAVVTVETDDNDSQSLELTDVLEDSVEGSGSGKAEVVLEQPIAFLTAQLEASSAQLTEDVMVSSAVEPVAIAAVESQQQVVVAPQNRDVMSPETQQLSGEAIAPSENDGDLALSEEQQQVASSLASEGAEKTAGRRDKVDPRFAALLKPRTDEKQIPQPLKDAAQLHGSKGDHLQPAETVPFQSVVETKMKQMGEPAQLTGFSAKEILEHLARPIQSGHHLQGQGATHVQGFDTVKAMPQTPLVQLSNGTQISESQIFDQVVTQLSGSVNGDSGRMVLRLQPAELGSLKLELKIEGDRVQAHLHAQTHQVQDVLERNLPQLRSSLAEQGLKIDHFLVNVDQRQAEGQFEGQFQHQQHGDERQSHWHQQDLGQEEHAIPLAHLMQNGGGGISLHV